MKKHPDFNLKVLFLVEGQLKYLLFHCFHETELSGVVLLADPLVKNAREGHFFNRSCLKGSGEGGK